jgi:hypothetical protein
MRTLLLAGLVGISAASGGCAFIDRTTDLTYTRNLKVPSGSGTVHIAQPTDKAIKRNKDGKVIIGPVRNGYSMYTADVLATSSVTEWVANAYVEELTAGGFKPTVVDKLPPGCPRGMEIEIQRVWVDLDMGFWTLGALGEVSCRVRLYRNGQLEKELQLDAQGQGPRALASMPEALYKESLKEALRAGLRETMPIVADTLRETR